MEKKESQKSNALPDLNEALDQSTSLFSSSKKLDKDNPKEEKPPEEIDVDFSKCGKAGEVIKGFKLFKQENFALFFESEEHIKQTVFSCLSLDDQSDQQPHSQAREEAEEEVTLLIQEWNLARQAAAKIQAWRISKMRGSPHSTTDPH